MKTLQTNQSVQLKRNMEILDGFYQLLFFLKQIGVQQQTLNLIELNVKNAYYKHGNFDFEFRLLQDDILLVDNLKIPLHHLGLNGGFGVYNSLNGTTTFNFGNIFNDGEFNLDGLTDTLNESGDPTLAAIGTGLQVLDGLGLDIETNINNVLQFGLSSWGASDSPDSARQKITQMSQWIENEASNFNNNPQQTLNKLEHNIVFLQHFFEHLLRDHTHAGSTRASHKMVIQFAKDMKSQFLTPIIQELKSKGVQLTSKTITNASIPDIYYSWMSGGYTGIMHGDKYSYKEYTLIAPEQTTTIATPDVKEIKENTWGTFLKVAGVGAFVYLGVTLLSKESN